MAYSTEQRLLADNARRHATAMFTSLRKAPDFDPDSPALFRKWRDYMIFFAVKRNEQAGKPITEIDAEEIGEQCACWFWNNYRPEEYAARMKANKRRRVHEVLESIFDQFEND